LLDKSLAAQLTEMKRLKEELEVSMNDKMTNMLDQASHLQETLMHVKEELFVIQRENQQLMQEVNSLNRCHLHF
jgi:hypothetical protein